MEYNTEAYSSTLSSKNQITLPSKIREKMNAVPGDQITFSYNDKDEIIVKVIKKDSVLSLFGCMPPKGESIEREWSEIREEAKEERITSYKDKIGGQFDE